MNPKLHPKIIHRTEYVVGVEITLGDECWVIINQYARPRTTTLKESIKKEAYTLYENMVKAGKKTVLTGDFNTQRK